MFSSIRIAMIMVSPHNNRTMTKMILGIWSFVLNDFLLLLVRSQSCNLDGVAHPGKLWTKEAEEEGS